MSAGYPCPYCGMLLQWVAQYNQYYCGQCQKYIPASAPAAPAATDPVDNFIGGISNALDGNTSPCPYCGQGARFNNQYGRWYCSNCQRWL